MTLAVDWQIFLAYLAAAVAAGSTGIMFKPGDWYAGLAKPAWTPPNWVFPVVWTTLYVATSYAAARVAGLPGAGLASALWALQIALNTLWTPVFFGAHRMRGAMVVMVALLAAVLAMTVAFFRLDLLAGLIVLPYLAWLCVAAALNRTVWRLNRGSAV